MPDASVPQRSGSTPPRPRLLVKIAATIALVVVVVVGGLAFALIRLTMP